MADDCLFCKIARGDIPVKPLLANDDVLAFPDINPAAPVHVLIIPRRHFATVTDMADQAPGLFGPLMAAAAEVARLTGVESSGYRLIMNVNADGGQEIFHVHLHLMGGEPIGPMRAR